MRSRRASQQINLDGCYIIALAALLVLWAAEAWALEKKGYTLPETGGYLYAGYFFHNPTFTARPHNSGLVLLRYGLHVDLQPSPWLTLSYDSNLFSDKQASNEIRPSEWDNHVGWRHSGRRWSSASITNAMPLPTGGPGPGV